MRDAKDAPIFSHLCDDPAAGEAIDAFVVGLAERVDELQDCEARNALNDLSERVRALAEQAANTGFETLALAARSIEIACSTGAKEEAYKALVELTEIARRIRLGHRGAV
ncbi:MAG: hypothetical protein OEM49_08915 [Myxococcales bacterium]|nr:hypothetical protein [Myxococcales bacterium]MDH5306597.1 hypothetical protein [Myxococcales bacterium]